MSNGVISLDAVSGNDTSGTEAETNDDAGFSELREACEAIGADADNAVERVKEDGGADEESLIATAREIADDDALWVALEQYRVMNDLHRIKQNHLLDSQREFTEWAAAFYGDTEDPDEGTYNHVQQNARSMGDEANLYYYKALFPEPSLAQYPAEQAVVWEERPDEDSHIYVTDDFAEAYSHLTLTIDGEERPVPPWDDASDGGSSEGGEGLDPRDFTVDGLKDEVRSRDFTDEEIEQLLEVEVATKDRKTAKRFLQDRLDSDDSDSSGKSAATIAGEVLAETGADVEPDIVKAMAENMSKQEILDTIN
jgi:hypothetical protein